MIYLLWCEYFDGMRDVPCTELIGVYKKEENANKDCEKLQVEADNKNDDNYIIGVHYYVTEEEFLDSSD